MSLTTVYFDKPCGEFAYTKAIVPLEALEFFEELGASTDVPEVGEASEEEASEEDASEEDVKQAGGTGSLIDSGDEGSGVPGSKKFLSLSIDEQRTKKGVIEIIEKLFSIALKKKDKLPSLKEQAIKLINEKL